MINLASVRRLCWSQFREADENRYAPRAGLRSVTIKLPTTESRNKVVVGDIFRAVKIPQASITSCHIPATVARGALRAKLVHRLPD